MIKTSEPYPIPDLCTDPEQAVATEASDDFSLSEEITNLFARYQFHITSLISLAKLEWKLSLKSLFFGLLLMICFALGLVVIWIGLNFLIGVILVKLGISALLSLVLVLLMQALFLAGLWHSIKDLTSRIGFHRTISGLKHL